MSSCSCSCTCSGSGSGSNEWSEIDRMISPLKLADISSISIGTPPMLSLVSTSQSPLTETASLKALSLSLSLSASGSASTVCTPIDGEFIEKLQQLRKVLEHDLLACDAKWSLFVAAATSYRYRSYLKPFPERYAKPNGDCDIESLQLVINEVPKLCILLRSIINYNYFDFDSEVIELLHWVLASTPLEMSTLNNIEYCKIIECLDLKKNLHLLPTQIFAVRTPADQQLAKFNDEHYKQQPKRYAYYGNRLDTFYSIVQAGLAGLWKAMDAMDAMDPMNPVNPMEAGERGAHFCLNRDIVRSLEYSPLCPGWGASACGSLIHCLALCEYLDVAEHVSADSSEEHGVLIYAGDLLRVRYLLFYGKQLGHYHVCRGRGTWLGAWFNQHKYTLSLACYILLLTLLGLANSSGRIWRHLSKLKIGFIFAYFKRLFQTLD